MDLLDKIDRTRFLGGEFILWLWFASEVLESEVPLPDGNVGQLFLDDQLILAHPLDTQEKSTLRGLSPSTTPEAKEALRQGKMPMRAHVGLNLDERNFSFSLEADPLAMTGIKLPTLVNEEIDEQFYERMMLLDELEAIVAAQFERFARLRLSRSWSSSVLPLMQRWVADSADFSSEDAKRRVLKALR